MLTRSRILAVLTIASFASIGCSGNGVTDTQTIPPVVPETLSLQSLSPANGAVVSQTVASYPKAPVTFSATVTDNKSSNVTVTYSVDGNTVSSQADVAPGAHSWCYTATSPSGMTLSNCSSSQSQLSFTVSNATFVGSVRMPTANGDYVPKGVYVTFGGKDSVKVDDQGNFNLPSPLALMDSIFIIARGNDSMVTSAHEIPKSLFGKLNIVGWPRALDLIKAITPVPPPASSSFFTIWHTLYGNVDDTYWVASWKSYPVCVAFASVSSLQNASNDTITASDSTAFWALLGQAMKQYGQQNGNNLVKPCSESDTRKNGGVLVALQLTPGVISTDYGSVGPNGFYGDYTSGVIIMNTHAAFAESPPVWHEFGHAFWGVGHTCAWDSIMSSSCPFYVPDSISATDVAYELQKFRTRDYERRYNTRLSLVLSIMGTQLERGLPLTPTVIIDANGNPIN
jgi:hypothetical protein